MVLVFNEALSTLARRPNCLKSKYPSIFSARWASRHVGMDVRCETNKEIPISILEQRERGRERDWGARHGCVSQEWSRVGRSGLGEPEV